MTSPGLKRPLDFDVTNPRAPTISGGVNTCGPVANGNKRRCTNINNSTQASLKSSMDHSHGTRSPFKDSSILLSTALSDDIASVIKDELHKTNNDQHCNGSDLPVLTVRQTQFICERVIKDREERIRDEYDKILACRIAEQYDILNRANYLKSLEPRIPASILPNTSSPSISALAAAYNMQRSVAATSATSLPELTTFATSLSANGHPSALATRQLAFNLQQQAANAAIQAQQQRVPLAPGANPSGPVLLVSNLDEQLATPEALFTLFGVFGDVIRVKILFNKKDNALIQMADANQAQVALGYLDKQKVYGKTIRVTRSKHQLVQMPRDGNQSDAGLTKDYTNSPLHRFKIPGSRNYLNIYPPSNTLHISNIPATIDEEEIQKAFTDACGFECSSFKFFPKDRKMALMKFNTIEQATIALIKMHNYQINSDNSLRVSFSKSVTQQ